MEFGTTTVKPVPEVCGRSDPSSGGGDGGGGTTYQFRSVNVVVCTRDRKRLYVAETFANKIHAIDIDAGRVSHAAGSGSVTNSDGPCLEAGMYDPRLLAFDRLSAIEPDSVLWIVAGNDLRRLDITNGIVTTVQLRGIRFPRLLSIDST